MRVYIDEDALYEKPKSCTSCPICSDYDDCLLQLRLYETWEDQYKNCPLIETED